MSRTVIGLFDEFSQAESAVRELENAGVPENNISVVANNANNEYNTWKESHPASGAAAGATTGTVVGGIGGILLGLGLFAIPGLGPLAAAGPLVAGLTGAGVGAATGGIIGALTDVGVPEEHAGYFAEGIRRGGTLVTVQAPDSLVDQVTNVLNRNGAVDINQRASYYQQTGFKGYNANVQPYTPAEMAAERERLRATYPTTPNFGGTMDHVSRDMGGAEGSVPGIQTGGHALDGTPDTRGIMEKTADTLTGDRIDDKTGKVV